MRAGRMDRLVTLQKPNENANDYNDPRDVSWNNVSIDPQVWAEKLPQRGTEKAEAGKESATSIVRWKLRYRSDLDATMRLKNDGKDYYFVEPPREIGRQEGLEIITEQR